MRKIFSSLLLKEPSTTEVQNKVSKHQIRNKVSFQTNDFAAKSNYICKRDKLNVLNYFSVAGMFSAGKVSTRLDLRRSLGSRVFSPTGVSAGNFPKQRLRIKPRSAVSNTVTRPPGLRAELDDSV